MNKRLRNELTVTELSGNYEFTIQVKDRTASTLFSCKLIKGRS